MTAIELRSRGFEVPGFGRVHALEAGHGPAVLFVHGWPMNAQLWRHVMLAMAPSRHVIALDLPGLGLTDRPQHVAYTSDLYAMLFDAILSQLRIERLGLCVHDAGGPIGLAWAVRQPERITQLCLLNTLVFPQLSWAARAFFAAAKLPGAPLAMAHPRAVALSVRVGMAHARPSAQTLQLYTTPFEQELARRSFIKAILDLDLSCLHDITRGLDAFASTPVRLLYGARDRILPDVAQTMGRVKDVLPHAQLTELPSLGHFLQEDDPQQVASLVRDFFCG